MTAHLGNWEVLACYFCRMGYAVNVVVREVYHKDLDVFLSRLRGRMRIKIIPRGMSLREIKSCFDRNEMVGILSDQNTGKKGVWMDFMGKPAFTPTGLVSLAGRLGVPILPGFISWQDGYRHLITVEDPIFPDPEKKLEGVIERARKCNDVISRYIYRHPEQWVWFHPRWDEKKGAIAR